MTDTQVAELCRLTVRAPARSIDLAVPADVPVADLLPAVLGYAGDNLEEAGLDHGGWVLQRLGGEPLDEERTLDSYGLRDGDTLYLRPRAEALPEVHLDDLVDGIATTMRDHPFGWTPKVSRRVLLGIVVAVLIGGVLVIAWPGGSSLSRSVFATAAGLLLLAGAGAASRAVGDAGAGAALGFMVGPYLALAGWLLPGGELSGPHAYETLGARLLAASAALAGGAVLALAVVAAFAALFLSVAVVSLFAAVAAVLLLTTDLAPVHAAGILAVLAVILGAFVPSLAFRMSGMRMPPLPTNAQQLQEGIEPHPAAAVSARAVLADGWMTSLYGAVGVVGAACVVVLARERELAEIIMTVALCLLLVLHARGLGNIWQRMSLVVPGVLGLLLLVLVAAPAASPGNRLVTAAGLLAAAAAVAIAAWTVPGRRLVPYWGRAGEILHSALAIAVLPLALWVLGVYGALRAING
ncbi:MULTISPECIES: type VII secretion integral membrane protein EccD [Streptomyces]|uniref:Type VII secretion integral membrane protein EccD n=3 Tax=Streptomyces TaxID=1883 RepID=A0A927BII6_STRGL|nr:MULTISPECIES: type VII secretion integral membrane protein EccD [Streptomyces]MBD2827335.1 type VII secretion integral membrane protein EccD [Streptomyces globisporus]MYW82070.1 type VII secretion integral membrane protein EccD [Streptomyces sp. SID8369]NEC45885.1 type VII secretion integral membrane protein EccD [Streptomyces sp. SID8016]MBD3545633.1 type VII secretion integral membrane protein EccD [Streptomyces sp. JV180]MBD3552593.1 type VII secretion integral membrane protein EccD [Str